MKNTSYTAFVTTQSGLVQFELHAETRKGAKAVLEADSNYPSVDDTIKVDLFSRGPTGKDVVSNAVASVRFFSAILEPVSVISLDAQATVETEA